jgi:hypothetical protein
MEPLQEFCDVQRMRAVSLANRDTLQVFERRPS